MFAPEEDGVLGPAAGTFRQASFDDHMFGGLGLGLSWTP
jgi:hypothetical protein